MKPFCLFALLAVTAGCRSTSHLPVVRDFEAERYMGVWYEAVRYPHRFEKGLSSVSAEYTLNSDGTIRVLNRGFDAQCGEWKSIEGQAKSRGNPDEGWLKVTFFKPIYASYRIVYLDEAYTRAIVTGPTYGYLWILTRDPLLPDTQLQSLIGKAVEMGFERERMILIDQSRNKP